MNVSKQHREDLLNKIQQIRTYIASAQQDTNTGNLLQYLDEITKDVKGKKYGLVFEQHREKIDEMLETHTPVLTEQKDLFIDNGGEMNSLIEGDNLAALKLLEKTHKGKIDVIYIDPPYNTGNKDFMYDDSFVGEDDEYKHSKWLSFMKIRLLLAFNLLKDDGVIFMSIDDNELAELKSLCDEIFGHQNFLANIVVESGGAFGAKTSHKDKTIFKVKDYVLCYYKNYTRQRIRQALYDKANEPFDPRYNFYIDNEVKMSLKEYLNSNQDIVDLFNRFSLEVDGKNISSLMKISDEFKDLMLTTLSKHIYKDSQFTLSLPDEILNQFENHDIVHYKKYILMKSQNGNIRHLQSFYSSLKQNDECVSEFSRSVLRGDLWKNFVKDMGNVAKEGSIDFKNGKKPVRLISQLIKWCNVKSSTILDFFAGSGTTGHAVMKLNAEDGGHRNFILCTNNENNICRDVTYERLKTVITGKRKDGSEYSEKYDASLKYYKIDFVKIDEKMYYEYADELLLHIRELVELENGVNFNGNAEIAIVLTDAEMEEFVADGRRDVARRVSTLYRGHDVLMTAEQEAFLQENGIKVNVIPDYYYNELNR